MRGMELPELILIEYRQHLFTLVSARRIHIVAPWLLGRPAADADLRFVAYMCLCCGEVLHGNLPGPYTNELGEAWAREALAYADDEFCADGPPPTRCEICALDGAPGDSGRFEGD